MRQRKYRGYTALIGHPTGMVYGSGCFIDESNKHYVISDETGKPDFIQVKEIEDWTGLHDKNGKEIYEGDVVAIDGSPVAVEWYSGAWTVAYFTSPQRSYLSQFDESDVEIAGNVWEHPNLLQT